MGRTCSQMNVFLDTQIYLSFYSFSKTDIEELRKVSALHQTEKIIVWLPEQVREEYWRNRESKIAQVLSEFENIKLAAKFPQMVRNHDRFHVLNSTWQVFKKDRDFILKDIREQTSLKELPADLLTKDIFDRARIIPRTDKISEQARSRMGCGTPPGKNNSLGDAINWLSLLEEIPVNGDLHLVSEDSDYSSPLHNGIADFLAQEWKEKKNGSVVLYKNLETFMEKQFPDEQSAVGLERKGAVENFCGSGNFKETHAAIKYLSDFDDFSDTQIQDIAQAITHNPQIYWIMRDDDVLQFVTNFLQLYGSRIPEEICRNLECLLTVD